MTYGYIRVSSKEQSIDRQLSAFMTLNINKSDIFIDRQSGKNFDRPSYKKLLKKLEKEDLLIVKSIDRLGRNYDEILEQWRVITKVKQANIFVVDFPLLDTRSKDKDLMGTFISDLVLQILSYVAQTEREMIRQRQAEGIACAKQKGIKFGREKTVLSAEFYMLKCKVKSGELSIRKAAELCGMTKTTFHKYYKSNEK